MARGCPGPGARQLDAAVPERPIRPPAAVLGHRDRSALHPAHAWNRQHAVPGTGSTRGLAFSITESFRPSQRSQRGFLSVPSFRGPHRFNSSAWAIYTFTFLSFNGDLLAQFFFKRQSKFMPLSLFYLLGKIIFPSNSKINPKFQLKTSTQEEDTGWGTYAAVGPPSMPSLLCCGGVCCCARKRLRRWPSGRTS